MTKDTKILLTKRNSGWGVKVRPQSTNVYEHILDFATPELKDWFIAKELFGSDKTNWKSLVRARSSKPAAQISDSSCRFVVDTKEYPDFTKQDFFNSDLAIVLQTASDGTENWSFFALNGCTLKNAAGNVYEYIGEIDIFFTYDVKDLFKDFRVGLSRAHRTRFTGTLPIGLSPDMYEEDFMNGISETYPVTGDLLNLKENVTGNNGKMQHYVLLSTKEGGGNGEQSNAIKVQIGGLHVWKEDGSAVFGGCDGTWTLQSYGEVGHESLFRNNPFLVVRMEQFENQSEGGGNYNVNDEDHPYMMGTVFSHFPSAFTGVISVPLYFESAVSSTVGWGLNFKFADEDITKTWNVHNSHNIMTHDVEIGTASLLQGWDFTKLKDITSTFDYTTEGAIYHHNINQIQAMDGIGNSYNFPVSNIGIEGTTLKMKLMATLNKNGVYYRLYIPSKSKNITYGIEGQFPIQTDKITEVDDLYFAYNKAGYDNSVKLAKKHAKEEQAKGWIKAMGGAFDFAGSIFTGSAFANIKGGSLGGFAGLAGTAADAGSEIANAKDELSTILAAQTDRENAPDSITPGNPYSYFFDPALTTEDIKEENKLFLELLVLRPKEIVLEKIAWLLHLSGQNMAGTLHKIQDFLDNRYYFNYVQTSTSLFENIRDDLKISQPLREVIDASFRNGLTIWHVRDKSTFKGIKQYDVNNTEMELLTNEETKVQ